mgnify:CR=1 FL=1
MDGLAVMSQSFLREALGVAEKFDVLTDVGFNDLRRGQPPATDKVICARRVSFAVRLPFT